MIDLSTFANTQHSAPLYIAVTGHRDLQDAATIRWVSQACTTILAQLQQSHLHGVVALSALAEGADTLFAEAALELGIPLETIVAYEGLVNDFAPGPARERYLRLRCQCQAIHTLPFIERSNGAYMALGYWLVDRCDLLVAVWNGLPAAGKGGTGDVVEYAQQQGRPTVQLHTLHHTIDLLS